MLLPQTRRELRNFGGGVLCHALKHIDEVGVGIDAVEATGDDQALDDADVAGAFGKQPRDGVAVLMGMTRRARSM